MTISTIDLLSIGTHTNVWPENNKILDEAMRVVFHNGHFARLLFEQAGMMDNADASMELQTICQSQVSSSSMQMYLNT